MTSFLGMDPFKGFEMANRLFGSAREVEASINLIRPIMTDLRSIWKGPDADRFIERWESQQLPALAEVVRKARDVGRQVNSAAENQQRASGGR